MDGDAGHPRVRIYLRILAMKLILALLLIKGRKIGKCTCRACWVLVLLMVLVLKLASASAWTVVSMGWVGIYDPDPRDRGCMDRYRWLDRLIDSWIYGCTVLYMGVLSCTLHLVICQFNSLKLL